MTPEQILAICPPPADLASDPESYSAGFAAALSAVAELLRKEGADDSLPVDEDWLRSVGFEKCGMFSLRIEAASQLPEGTASFWLDCTDYLNLPCPWELWNTFPDKTPPEGACLPCVPKTRGDVRRLCEALGVTLSQETKTAPGA